MTRAQKALLTNILNEHAHLKERALKDDHVPFMHSEPRKQIYKKNMLTHKHKKDLANDWKLKCFRVQRNKAISMRKKQLNLI